MNTYYGLEITSDDNDTEMGKIHSLPLKSSQFRKKAGG